ncbi:MAG: polysaccharide biosynthesis tyrosine autokinase [Sedimentisphaerales bacterium]|nr:polysaccharide biosynthesis tyrosine autokinase [Sedimentisphaerales bacterium]
MVRRGPATAGSSAGTGFTFRDIVRTLRRRLWLIVLITLVFSLGAGVLCFVLRKYRPQYSSVGMIKCKSPVQEDILRGFDPVPNRDLVALETANQVAYLTSDAFLGEVLKRDAVQNTQWAAQYPDIQVRLAALKKDFVARAQRGTEYVLVGMTAGNPKEAKSLLDEILEVFRLKKLAQSTDKLNKDLQSLRKEKGKIDTEVLEKRQAQNTLRVQANVPGWGSDQNVVQQELSMMHREKMLLDAQMKDLQIRIAQLQQEQETQGYSTTVQAAIEADPLVMGYRSQILNYQTSLDGMSKRLGDDHQTVQQIQVIMTSLNQQMAEREQLLRQQYAAAERRSLNNRLQSLQQQYEEASRQYDQISARQSDLDEKRSRHLTIQQEIEDLLRSAIRIEERINSKSITLDKVNEVQEQITYGTQNDVISFPRWSLFLPGGFLLGLFLAVGLVFLLEFLDDNIKSPSDVLRYLQVPFLGMIPEYDGEDRERAEIAKMATIHPQSLMSESYRQVRTNLYFSAPPDELKQILITSSGRGCGKTTTAVNLAVTFAAEGKRVLLADANFRRSAINRLFPAEGPPRGLSNVLVGQATAADVIRPSGIEGLDVIDAGPTPPNPAVLLSSERMKSFLESQRAYYDHIIIDGPPALLLSDARILAGLADGTILVIHAGNTSRGIVGRMIREMKTDKVHILGAVLNAVRPQKGGYFRESYRNYYDYISSPAERKPVGALPQAKEQS